MGKMAVMEDRYSELRSFLKSLSQSEQSRYAKRCGTTIGYLRKAMSAEQDFGDALVVALDRESSGAVRCERLRPDIDWAYLRGSSLSTTKRKTG
jgi:DNA-binding transcriptional regulator YdaS (Cro superfamily)